MTDLLHVGLFIRTSPWSRVRVRVWFDPGARVRKITNRLRNRCSLRSFCQRGHPSLHSHRTMTQTAQTNGVQPLSKTWELSLYELQRTPQVRVWVPKLYTSMANGVVIISTRLMLWQCFPDRDFPGRKKKTGRNLITGWFFLNEHIYKQNLQSVNSKCNPEILN